jgi:hypothetical protein
MHEITCEEGHHICADCVHQAVQNGVCPIENGHEKGVSHHLAVRTTRKIQKLKVGCILNEKECDWSGVFPNLEDHINWECDFTLMKCELCGGKNLKILRKDLKNHYVKCIEYPCLCPHCSLKFPRNVMKKWFRVQIVRK